MSDNTNNCPIFENTSFTIYTTQYLMNTNQQKVNKYYSSLESKLGFDLILWGSKHFGFYPSNKATISEKAAQILLQDLVASNIQLSQGQRVLDAGSGQGVVSVYLAKKYGAQINGITIVPFEVQKAQQRATEHNVQDTTQYQLMDYSATTFSDNYFDAIYTTETLSHSPDIRKTLKEMLRILKPGGRFAFFEYTLALDKEFTEWEMKMLNTVIEGSAMLGLKDFRHDKFPEIIKAIGFENVKEQNITDNIRPSFYRLHKLSILPYKIINLLGIQKQFTNTTAGYEYFKFIERGLFRYCIFTGNKPK